MSDTIDELGRLDRDGERFVLAFRRRLAHPPERVWRALTDPEDLEHWFPTTIDGRREPGARLSFSFRGLEMAPMDGEMLAFDPPRLMELRWGEDVLRFALEPDGEDGTLLVLSVTFVEFGKAARDGAGWHTCLAALADLLGATDASAPSAERWRAVHPAYVERLGPDAAAIGPPEWADAHGLA